MQLVFNFCWKELCVLNGKDGALGPAKETKMYVEIKKVTDNNYISTSNICPLLLTSMAKYPEAMLTPKRKMMAAGMIFISW